MDDSELGRRFATGEDVFTSIFEMFRGPVFGIALHVLADPGLAEEATQLAFLGVWRSRKRFDPDRSLGAWIFGITRKAAIDIYRRERRMPATVAEGPEPAVEAESVVRLWEAWEVRRAIERLPVEEAEVMRLVHYYQMTHSEAAAHLQVPIGTVKSRSFRAHRKLAEALSHLFEEGSGPDGATGAAARTSTGPVPVPPASGQDAAGRPSARDVSAQGTGGQ